MNFIQSIATLLPGLVVLAASATAHAAPANLELVSEGTTRTEDSNNVCPKTYTFKYELRAVTAGTFQYRFERSDGAKCQMQNGTAYAGQLIDLSTTWELGRSVSGAWVGVSVNGGTPMHDSSFTLDCAEAEAAKLELLSEGTTRTDDSNNVCPKTYTFKYELKALTAGAYHYQFVRSDGGKGPVENGTAYAGQIIPLATTWELGRAVTAAWIGVSINGAAPAYDSTFTLICQ